MRAAVARGYGTCAQIVLARHEPTIVQELHFPVNRSVVRGLSLGVPDDDVAIDNISFPPEAFDAFCTFQ